MCWLVDLTPELSAVAATAALAGLLATLAAGVILWAVSLALRDASIADIWWGPSFVLLAGVYSLVGTTTLRAVVTAALLTIWATRLATHIGTRWVRHGEDQRYRALREARGAAFWWKSLFVVFWLQGALAWVVAMPVLVVATAPGPSGLVATDVIGGLLFAAGLLTEATADWQLRRFRSDPGNTGRVLDRGLWRYSRHPNYFGDALVWWGLYLVACSVPNGWLSAVGPAVMTVLLRYVSGVSLAERFTASRPAFAAYAARTSAFVPWPPRKGR